MKTKEINSSSFTITTSEVKPMDKDIIQELCEKEGYKLAKRIDDSMAIVIKKKPSWCPTWLYKQIIKESVLLISKNNF